MTMKSKSKQFGFSAWELVVVFLFIGALTLIAIPALNNYRERSHFAEVIAFAEPYKKIIQLELEKKTPLTELNIGSHNIPVAPKPNKILANFSIKNGTITIVATPALHNLSYIITPDVTGASWKVEGTCLQASLCDS